jgi:hypothetical protein
LTTLGVTFAATSAMVRPDGSWTAEADGAVAPDGAADPDDTAGAAGAAADDDCAADPDDDGAVADGGGARSCDESER